MNILTTVFLRYDNQKIFYPNSVLSTKPISNYYRSPDMGDAIDFAIHISTPMERIALMKERITRYVWWRIFFPSLKFSPPVNHMNFRIDYSATDILLWLLQFSAM